MLYIDPAVCIDCGACADACPVDAAVPADALSETERAELARLLRSYGPTTGEALAWARERKSLPNGDLDRAENQRNVIKAIVADALAHPAA